MTLTTIITTAIALAMDAFAVSIAVGISLKKVSVRQTFRLSWHFGLFQALMPVIGWNLGLGVRSYIESYDHWIAFFLLFLVGGNMLREAFAVQGEDENQKADKDATKGLTLVVLSVATSIDALAVGFSMSLLATSIVLPAVIIGVVALLFTVTGLHLGKSVAGSKKISRYAEILGGIVLWAIGISILHEHRALDFLLVR